MTISTGLDYFLGYSLFCSGYEIDWRVLTARYLFDELTGFEHLNFAWQVEIKED